MTIPRLTVMLAHGVVGALAGIVAGLLVGTLRARR